MACYWPIRVPAAGARSGVLASDGERQIVPCGGCVGCRLERSRQWAVRCMHEAACHEENAFVTLTYDDEHLPPDGGLDRRAFPLFMKRLRKEVAPARVRFFHCGEYGAREGRPHYHALLFGVGFRDRYPWAKRKGRQVYRSPLLEQLWQEGNSEVDEVTFGSAAYVARYAVKKSLQEVRDELLALDGDTGETWPVPAEYATMSRRPGIGRPWLDRFGGEVYPSDGVVVAGRLAKPPRYYDEWYEVQNPESMASVKVVRQTKRSRPGEGSGARLRVREEVARARLRERSLG